MAEEFNNSLLNVASHFLKDLRVPYTKNAFRRCLETHSYFPSLYSLSEVLNEYNVENKGLKITPEQVDELPVPFLAYYQIKATGAKDFVNVMKVSPDSVTYYYDKEKTISKEEFLRDWAENTVLIAEKTKESGEKEYEQNKKQEIKNRAKKNLLIAGFALFVIAGIYKYFNTNVSITAGASILLFSLGGLVVSVLLLVYEIDKSNAFVKNICTGGTKVNCNAVLGSKASKIFGVSWGEMGFFYFAAFTLFLLIPNISFQEKTPYLSYVSALSACYIPFSIYYQYKVVKQWCRLCLMVQAILFLSLIWTFAFGKFTFSFSNSEILFFIGSALLPVLLWYTLKPILLNANDKRKFEAAYKRLYSRKDVFELTLSDQEKAPDGWQYLGIHKGNPDAENVILKVCSPLCKHCFISHAIFNEILEKNSNVRLVILYDIDAGEEDNQRRLFVRHFLALAEQENKKLVGEAMDYWYLNENRNDDTLKEIYPVPEEILARQESKIDLMREWCRVAEISYTPTVYINGMQLPGTFNLEDLKDYFC